MKIKFSLLKITLAAVAVFAMAACLFAVSPVKAENPAIGAENVFEIDNDGVSLKLNEDGGMRFIVKMDETVRNYVLSSDNISLGFVIAPKALIEANDGDYINMTATKITADKNKIYKYGDYYYANGCVVTMLEKNRAIDYTMVAYIKNGDAVERYTAINAGVYGNFYDVAIRSLLYTEEDYSVKMLSLSAYEWLGTNDYPVLINSVERYNALVAKINGGYTFGNRIFEAETSLDLTGAAALSEGKTLPENFRFVSTVTYYVDGAIYATEKVTKGSAATTADPVKEADEIYTYEFIGWVDEHGNAQDLSVVNENKTVYANFKQRCVKSP